MISQKKKKKKMERKKEEKLDVGGKNNLSHHKLDFGWNSAKFKRSRRFSSNLPCCR